MVRLEAMTRVWIAIAFLIALCLAMAWHTMPAKAQPNCQPERAMLTWLRDLFGEFVQLTGHAKANRLIITANPRDGTWSAITIDPSGNACIVMSGTSLQLNQGT